MRVCVCGGGGGGGGGWLALSVSVAMSELVSHVTAAGLSSSPRTK